MAKLVTFVYLLMTLGHIFTFPGATGQWIVLDENAPQEERLKAAGLFDLSRNVTVPCNETNHPQYCSCEIRTCLDPEDYVMINGTAYVEAYNTSYNSSFYKIEGDCLMICAPDFLYPKPGEQGKSPSGKYSTPLTYITLIGLGISMLCLVLHLIAFMIVRDVRNIPGYCMACLCVSLLAGYISFLVGFDDYMLSSGAPCIAAASSTHFFLLSSVLWMNVMAFDVFKSLLNATGKLVVKSTRFSFKNFYVYCLYAWGVALAFAIAAVVSDTVSYFPEEYRPHFGQGLCWFRQKKALLVFFAAPVFAVICMNVLFFGLSAYTIVSNKMKGEQDPHRGMLKRNLVMYIRLAVIMGLTWVIGLLAGIIDAVFLWYLFAIFNTLQGLFIFLAFTCTPKVKNHFSSKKFSQQTVSPTFQSYYSKGNCSNGNYSNGNYRNGKSIENITVVRKT